jgi:hypothetical protein
MLQYTQLHALCLLVIVVEVLPDYAKKTQTKNS